MQKFVSMRLVFTVIEKPSFLNTEMRLFLILSSIGPLLDKKKILRRLRKLT